MRLCLTLKFPIEILEATPPLVEAQPLRAFHRHSTESEAFPHCAAAEPLDLNPGRGFFWKREHNFCVTGEQRRPFEQSRFRSYLREIGIVRALRKVRQNQVTGLTVKSINQPFGHVLV